MKLFNSLTNKKEEFVPIDENNIKIYACGPTVYNFCHIGNARPQIIFDVLRRYLEYRGHTVTFVQNFTDIDDKMIDRAKEENITVKDLADRFIAEYFVDAKGLGLKEASVHPKATENIDEIISIISTLFDKGYAYESGGDVYYRARKFEGYGKLSNQPIEDLEAGARVSPGETKEDPIDFALWKASKPGEPSWDSPWGPGRPGWHIECSAMARRFLGETIDIHCGGIDLIFPHHENEIAQSEAANDKEFARFWLHNGFIDVDNKKMSKSLGNFFTVRDVAQVYGYEVIRFFMLSAHYRNPLNYSTDILDQARAGLERLYNCKRNVEFMIKNAAGEKEENFDELLSGFLSHRDSFIKAMDDDINTADALSAIFELVRDINTACSAGKNPSKELCESALEIFNELCAVLGLCGDEDSDIDEDIENMISQRDEAKKAKDFKTADEIRDKLKDMGIVLQDTAYGTKWTRAN